MEVENALALQQAGDEVEEVEVEQSGTADAQDAGGEGSKGNADEQAEQKHKRPGGFQRRIQRLEREVEVWRSEALKGQKTTEEAKPVEKAPEESKKPEVGDFDTYEEYVEALTDWKTERAIEKREKKATEKAEAEKKTQQQKTVQEKWNEQVARGRKAHADFDDVARNDDLKITPAMAEVIIESEVGEEIAYYLGQHEEEAARIADLSPLAAARELGKIEARLAKQETKAEGEEKEAPPISKAPAPITPVSKFAPVGDNKLRDDLPFGEWKKRREAQLRK